MLLFLAIISILIFLLLILFFTKYQLSLKQYTYKKNQSELELKKYQETEQALIEELSLIKTQLHNVIEDPVTKLLSWQVFEDRLTHSIQESIRYQFTMAVLVIDIDDFKVINDALGYEVGDQLLIEVAKRLQTCIRQVDSISRFNKDTFVILLTQLAKPETAAVVAQRVLQTLRDPCQIMDHELYITVCIGISIYPVDGADAITLLRNANAALQIAKQKDKHTYQFYQEKLHINSQRELVLYNSLKRESIFQEFITYFQPIMNVKDQNIFCMDALLFWQHPDVGLLEPKELFGYIEKQRKLNSITEWLLKNICKQFLHWRSLGFSPQLLGMPLSIIQLESSQFICRLPKILQEIGFDPAWLLIEIKESATPVSFEILEKGFNMLNYIGAKLAIDQFGCNIFSLIFLKHMNVDYLKLDQALIKDIETNPRAVSIIKSIITLAENISAQIIVQGVQSEKQMTILKELGCVYMQGQHLGAPILEHEVTGKIVTSTNKSLI